jgi:hypothetical protein
MTRCSPLSFFSLTSSPKPRTALSTSSLPPPASARIPLSHPMRCYAPSNLSAAAATTPSPASRSEAPASSSRGTNRARRRLLLLEEGIGGAMARMFELEGVVPARDLLLRSVLARRRHPRPYRARHMRRREWGVLLPLASSTSTPVAEGLGFCRPTGAIQQQGAPSRPPPGTP